jgi:MoaA/NifB/PqqE/SkfB family radical SAM enzyme
MVDIYSPDKLLFHLGKLDTLKQNKKITPNLVELHLEAYCNDNCMFCSFRKDNGTNRSMLKLIDGQSSTENKPIGKPSDKSRIPLDVVMNLPKMMKECNIPSCLFSGGGEPTIYPYFDIVLDEFIKYGIELALITNGTNLNDSRIDKIVDNFIWIRFSMDSSKQETHKLIHKTPNEDFDRRVKSIKKMCMLKKLRGKDLTIGISFIITKDNVDDIEDSAKFFHEVGVDNIRFSYMFDESGDGGFNSSEINLVKNRISKLKELYGDFIQGDKDRVDLYSKPNNDFSACYIQHFNWVIGADSLLYPCCIMTYHPSFVLADISKQKLTDIVNSNKVYEQMMKLNPKSCLPCWLRQKNQFVEKIFNEPNHKNYC